MYKNCFLSSLLLSALLLTNSAQAESTSYGRINGFAELHSHLMAEYQFGGSWFWGKNSGPMEQALARCDGGLHTHDMAFWDDLPTPVPSHSHAATILGPATELFGDYHGLSEAGIDNPIKWDLSGGDVGIHLGKRRGFDNRKCRYVYIDRIWGIKVEVPGTCPRPHFQGWPSWDTRAHQQMWEGWLKDAFEGGMKLMVVSIAESEMMCKLTPPHKRRFPCGEMDSVRRQLQAFQTFVERNNDWLAVAKTPDEARNIIQVQNKLALVLSVEITDLFPSGDIEPQLQDFYDLGVRSIHLAHHANSRFAGVAPFSKLVNKGGVLNEFNNMSGIPAILEVLEGLLGSNDILTVISQNIGIGSNFSRVTCTYKGNATGAKGDCDGRDYLNAKGLTSDGRKLVKAMMERRMLIDLAHSSRNTIKDVYEVSKRNSYPMFSSHVHLADVVTDPKESFNEKYLTQPEIDMFVETGGMAGVRTGPEKTRTVYSSGVLNNCQGSSKSFAQSVAYAVDHNLTIGFGADLNGFIEQMLPRYGAEEEACWGNNSDQDAQPQKPWYERSQFDGQGLAHIGLLPVLVNDLEEVGLNQQYIDHINSSAENFVQMWERAHNSELKGDDYSWFVPLQNLIIF
ncbi:membrane dipeptidase [Microbulbifer rhizosphaerae]|uniref:Microsomal dipeptidase-like Zn-dependent dipeptidase n=1 Tax=Microbulbifer rhizosphaerae TaxID=1562603 RepID=A0A7W4Z7U7_9GAMM|nr:membrane dipeptidase [Microbulbifer rhizosphaerae]MBB3059892.1 microsomal dipeptidase-like Zn-dependent dipeptidase [Microbulbifer rhizosphaerae]